jgi:hypothetical protein
MAIAGTLVVEIRVDVPAALVGLFIFVVSTFDRFLTPSVKERHPVIPSTLHVDRLCGASRKVCCRCRVEKRGGRVSTGSVVGCWGRGRIVSIESVYRGPATSVERRHCGFAVILHGLRREGEGASASWMTAARWMSL